MIVPCKSVLRTSSRAINPNLFAQQRTRQLLTHVKVVACAYVIHFAMLTDIILNRRTLFLGLLSWALPFALSFLFFDQTGQLVVPRTLFKSLMVVIGGGIGVGLLVIAFQRIEASFLSGAAIGCYWLALNLMLDLLILVPMSAMTYTEYFYDIGLRYLLLPIIAAAMGKVATASELAAVDR